METQKCEFHIIKVAKARIKVFAVMFCKQFLVYAVHMLSYLFEYVLIFIEIYHHIYLLLNSNSDKNYIQNITSVNFL